jgi:hypothetical protein
MLANWISRRRDSRRPLRTAARRAIVETVEGRQYCDGNFGNAVALGAPAGLIIKTGSVDNGANKHDFYKITTTQAGRLRVSLSKMTGDDADLILYNASNSGAQIGSSTNGGLSDELIDIASVPAKTYYMEVVYSGGGAKSNYQLGVQTDYAGNTTATSKLVGVVNSTEKVVKEFVGNSDKDDYFKFNTTSNGMITLKLDGLSGDADLQLLDSSGTLLKSSTLSGTQSETIFHGSAGATYFAHVYNYLSNTTNYSLHLKNAALPGDGGSNFAVSPTDLGTLGSKTINAFIVNKFDNHDYYKFFVAEPGPITVNLTGLKADLNISVTNPSNATVFSTKTGSNSESLTIANAAGGTYTIHIFQGVGAGDNGPASPYTLDINAPTDTAGNTKANAKTLTLAGGIATANGFVGDNDVEDWYKVTIPAGKTLHGTINMLTADADIELFDSNLVKLDSSSNNLTNPDTVDSAVLPAGTYYFRVFKFSGNPSYRLTVTTT